MHIKGFPTAATVLHWSLLIFQSHVMTFYMDRRVSRNEIVIAGRRKHHDPNNRSLHGDATWGNTGQCDKVNDAPVTQRNLQNGSSSASTVARPASCVPSCRRGNLSFAINQSEIRDVSLHQSVGVTRREQCRDVCNEYRADAEADPPMVSRFRWSVRLHADTRVYSCQILRFRKHRARINQILIDHTHTWDWGKSVGITYSSTINPHGKKEYTYKNLSVTL